MVRHIRHVHARTNQWIKIHRHRFRSAPCSHSSSASARIPVLVLLVAITAAGWFAYQLCLATWIWLSANWRGFIAGLVAVTGIVLFAQRHGGER